ncbi:DUF456 domain-containing protein [Kurthia sibirica]|uniref:DUF1269 domain-containing protein n=1 Tax=Kurthia sibirica TaxID=202750 RepID=A0A2U3ANB2_9BACL|nr:DUF456 domain-containing protein [Kurthia sibirica]PWI26005.1 DUF1269 domain-containing protein [Kurthia sibirica]GEK35276.1 hypothetical protein KSI01_28090 [Kurthia sibirica]
MENIIVSYNSVESEAFQTFTEIKNNYFDRKTTIISQAVLLKKKDGKITLLDSLDTGETTTDDTLKGGLIGALVGILAGPFGLLLGFGVGTFIGSFVDMDDIEIESSLINAMTNRLKEGDMAIIILAQEEDESLLDELLNKYDTFITRYDAAFIEEEVENANLVAADLKRQAKEKLSEKRSAERKEKIDNYKIKMKNHFNQLKKPFSS